MDAERQYLSVTIPINKHFINNKQSKDIDYESKIIGLLKKQPLSLTELAKALGYKGISQRLRNSIDNLISKNIIIKVLDKSGKPKLSIHQ